MKNYKVYGNTNTNLALSEKAYKAYSSYDPIEIREYEYDVEDENGDIVTDDYGNAIKEYKYQITGAFEENDMTAEEVNELFEEDYDSSYSYDLRIHYKNNEENECVKRFTGISWTTNDAEDIIYGMINSGYRNVIRDIAHYENVDYVDLFDGHGLFTERYDKDELLEMLGE